MGKFTDAAIETWQEHAGLEPATGDYRAVLEDLSQAAFDMIKVIELERSGIRDGDGRWHGSDVVGATMRDMIQLCERVLKKLHGANAEAARVAEVIAGLTPAALASLQADAAASGDEIGDALRRVEYRITFARLAFAIIPHRHARHGRTGMPSG
jgi:hypothetical protein